MFPVEELLKIAEKKVHLNNVNAITSGHRIGKTPYVVEKTLYRGDLTFTYLAKNSVSGQQVVIKEFFPMSDFVYEGLILSLMRTKEDEVVLKELSEEKIKHLHTLKTCFKEEAESFKKLSGEKYLVSVMETYLENNTCYTVFEYLPYPTLNTLLKEKLLKPSQAVSLFVQVVQAVENIHSRGHVHKSIKPSNIYVTETHVILGDYSAVKETSGIKLNHVSIDNDVFVAPEIQNGEVFTKKADIYSLGKVLEYLMEHIGYRSGNPRRVGMGEHFESSKIDGILRNSLEINQNKRETSLLEMAEITSPKSRESNKQVKIFKLFLVVVLSILAVVMVFKSDLVQDFIQEEDDETLETSEVLIQDKPKEYRMLTKKQVYDFGENIVIYWHDSEESLYTVTVERNGDTCCTIPIFVDGPKLDLTGLSLNPGWYSAVIRKANGKNIYHDFRILEGLMFSEEKGPSFDYDTYGFYEKEMIQLHWETKEVLENRLVVYDVTNKVIVQTFKTKEKTISLDNLNLTVGEYLVSVQSLVDNKRTIYDHTSVRVYSDQEVKALVVLTKNHVELTLEDYLEWLPTVGEVHIKLTNTKTAAFVSKVFRNNENRVVLSSFNLPLGNYEASFTHVVEDKFSAVIKKRLVIVAK